MSANNNEDHRIEDNIEFSTLDEGKVEHLSPFDAASEKYSPYPLFLSDLPEASGLEQFLQNPLQYRPRPEHFINVYMEDDTVLTHAVKIQSTPIIGGLLMAGADANVANKKGITPISAAAHKGNTEVMQMLIDAGALVNALNSSGSTALIQASHFGHVDAVKILLRNHATADFANTKGTTALMRASQEGHVEISELLIRANVDVNKKNNEGMNALMLSSQRGHADMTLLLIKAGASMDEQTSQGSTALMLACKRNHEKVVEVLVSMGSEIYMRDSRGRTAKDTAIRRNNISLVKWLDTQVQIERIQDYRRRNRSMQLLDLRKAFSEGRLRMTEVTVKTINALKSSHPNPRALPSEAMVIASGKASSDRLSSSFSSSSSSSFSSYISPLSPSSLGQSQAVSSCRDGWVGSPPLLSKDSSPKSSVRGGYSELLGFPVGRNRLSLPSSAVDTSISAANIASSSKSPGRGERASSGTAAAASNSFEMDLTSPLAVDMATAVAASMAQRGGHRHPYVASRPVHFDWEWPLLLKKCLEMPPGIFELVVEYLPLPRIWQWSLWAVKKRCKLAPQQAILDLSTIVDEILTDATIFPGHVNSGLLVQLNRTPQIHLHLIMDLGMSPTLLRSLCEWSDVQSLTLRMSENEVVFKAPLAKQLLNVAISLYKWQRCRGCPQKALAAYQSAMAASNSSSASRSGGKTNNFSSSAYKRMNLSDGDALEATDAGGEDDEDEEDDDRSDAAGMEQDQDTETEHHGGDQDLEETQDDDIDSDSEGELINPNVHANAPNDPNVLAGNNNAQAGGAALAVGPGGMVNAHGDFVPDFSHLF